MIRRHIFQVLFGVFLFSCFNYSQTTTGLIGYWPFNGSSNDLSGYSNNGIVHNTTLTTDRFGNSNNAFYFSGNSYIDFGNNIPLLSNQLTISVWLKTNYYSSSETTVVSKYGILPNTGGFQIWFGKSIASFCYTDGKGNGGLIDIGGADRSLDDNRWHHIVGTINNSIVSVWLDGEKICQYDNNSSFDLSANYNFYAGNIFYSGIDQNSYFVGSIDDIRLYNSVLTDSEIQALYNEPNGTQIAYNIIANNIPSQGGTTKFSGMNYYGSTLTVTAMPNSGYKFVNFTENGNVVSSDISYSFLVTGNRTLCANYVQSPQFTVITSSYPTAGGTTTGSGVYNANTNVQVAATPNNGYKFVNWTENGNILSSNPIFFFYITSDRNLVANFALDIFTVNISSSPVSGGATSGSGTYNANSNVQVIATPNTNYKFVNWTENGLVVSTNASYSFVITNNRNLVANFNLASCTITTSSNPSSGGSTSGGGTYDLGSSVLVIAVPNSGYSFVNWTENGVEVSKNSFYSFTASGNRNLVANFATMPNLSVSPLYIGVGTIAGTANFYVTNTTGGSMNWNAVSNSSWLTITSGSSGTNNGTINISYQANQGSYRVGTITITTTGTVTGSPQTVEVRQSAFVNIEKINGVPATFVLYQNYPNPFNPATRIQFGVSNESYVTLKVYNVLGNEVSTLVSETMPVGIYSVIFDASKLNNGIYFYKLQASNFSQTRKMILLK